MTTPCINAIENELEAGKIIVIDGATGTELEHRGAPMHEKAWCAMATATNPELLRAVHEDYIHAGARVITANTFSTNRNMLEPAGLGSRFVELNRRAVEIALQARHGTATRSRVAVAGSMSHQVPVQAGTSQRNAHAIPPAGIATKNFHEMAELLALSGVDLILMEMMSDPELANPAIAAALTTGLPVWVGFSVRLNNAGKLVSYARPDLSVAQMFDMIPLDGIRAAGVMHSEVDAITPTIELLKQHFKRPLMAYPESGYFKMPHWQFVDIISVTEFVDYNRKWVSAGVQIVGGCCGLGVEHIKSLHASFN